MNDAVKMALEALADIRTSIECAAGCDEGIDPMAAVSEIMSAYGTAMASAYSRAADMVNILTTLEQAGEPGADDARDKLAGEHGEQCERCQGNGEIVTDWDRYMHVHDGDVGDEAVADCPDCSGTGRIEGEAPLPTLQRLGQEFDAGEASEGLREAIAATEYKYFGDYEMSDAQRKAVDVLVDHARASLALKADNRSSMERLGDILRGSSFKPTQKYLGAAFLGYDYARRYYAHPPQSRGQAFDGEGMIEAVDRFIADVDDGDRAEAGNNPLMEAHIADLRAALSSAKRGEEG